MSANNKKQNEGQTEPTKLDLTVVDARELEQDPAKFGYRFFDLGLDMFCVAGLDGLLLKVNAAFESTLGYSAQELLQKPFLKFVHPEDAEATKGELEKLERGSLVLHFENRYRCKDGSYKWLAWKAVPFTTERLVYAVARDVTLAKRAEEEIRTQAGRLEASVQEKTQELNESIKKLEATIEQKTRSEKAAQQQVQRLDALRRIDTAISSSVDLDVIFDVLLDQTTSRLEVDAAAIYLVQPGGSELELAAGKGFLTNQPAGSPDVVAKEDATKCMQERKVVHTRNLAEIEGYFGTEIAEAEGFVCCTAAPLVVKGKVTGVLKALHREPLDPEEDWYGFLKTLAVEAAAGIDLVTRFHDLEKSKDELVLALDATLESWVRALDLRDNEMEGHTQRVTELAVRLAKRMGVADDEIVHIRRGALLHDIGKTAIPDRILHKQGPLTEDEAEAMKRHPEYAYEWLSKVKWLRPALDVAYAHHEKWDGTGFPRGLAGEAIPLSARIFAVVDAWDALTSDQTYRKAWVSARARRHVLDSSGTFFDPAVVKEFVEIVDREPGLEAIRRAA